MQEVKNVVVIGASAGGMKAVCALLSSLKGDINAALLVVIHLSRRSRSEIIVNYFKRHTRLACSVAEDGLALQNNTVYLARPDHHLLLVKGRMYVRRGAYENEYRPSIDVLFRSAAASYNSCATGIILSGLLDDGVSGMAAIRRSGGLCVVQHPEEAEYADMPVNVLNNLRPDYVVPVMEIGYILNDRFSETCTPSEVPEDIRQEATITLRMNSEIDELRKIGEATSLTCPDCGGVLSLVEQQPIFRYRCYTGHSFTEAILLDEQLRHTEEALWVAIRMMEERKNLLQSHTRSIQAKKGQAPDARTERWMALEAHIQQLKKMLTFLGKNTGE